MMSDSNPQAYLEEESSRNTYLGKAWGINQHFQ